MNNDQQRTHKLQQIPVFALRAQLYQLLKIEDTQPKIEGRIIEVLGIQTQDPKLTIDYLNRDRLIKLINACPEIDDGMVDTLFEEYRYGTNPSFYIYIFDTALVKRPDRVQMQGGFWKVLNEYNEPIPEDLPRVRKLVTNYLSEIENHQEIVEGNYRFQKRNDLIDENQNPTSVYETLYGFFWINFKLGYVIIHAQDREILHTLELAISEGAGIHLVSLVITKELKNALPFLLADSLRSSKLHDPDPDSPRFRWITFVDDNLYAKGYQAWEDRYPEIRNARYQVDIDAVKSTSLNIRFESGVFSLAGKLTATQFRKWTLERLTEIIGIISGFKKHPVAYIQTHGFRNVPELSKFTAAQKDHITNLITLILDLKTKPGIGYRDTGLSPLLLAEDMGRHVRVQFHMECEEVGCDVEGFYACEHCGETIFNIKEVKDKWFLECQGHRNIRWSKQIPLDGVCEKEHEFTIPDYELEKRLEILPTNHLLRTISDIVGNYIPGYEFFGEIESFMVRGRNLFYFDNKEDLTDTKATPITNIFNKILIEKVEEGANVYGIKINHVTGEVNLVDMDKESV